MGVRGKVLSIEGLADFPLESWSLPPVQRLAVDEKSSLSSKLSKRDRVPCSFLCKVSEKMELYAKRPKIRAAGLTPPALDVFSRLCCQGANLIFSKSLLLWIYFSR